MRMKKYEMKDNWREKFDNWMYKTTRVFAKPVYKWDETMDKAEILIDRVHTLYIEKHGDRVTYQEIVAIIKDVFRCDHCFGASMGDCEECEEVRGE